MVEEPTPIRLGCERHGPGVRRQVSPLQEGPSVLMRVRRTPRSLRVLCCRACARTSHLGAEPHRPEEPQIGSCHDLVRGNDPYRL